MNFTIVKGPLLDYIYTYNSVFESWLQILCQLSHQVIPSLLNFSKSRCCLTMFQTNLQGSVTEHNTDLSLPLCLGRSACLCLYLSIYLSISLSPFHLSVCLLTMEVCNTLKVSMRSDHLWKDTYECLRSPSSSSPPAIWVF